MTALSPVASRLAAAKRRLKAEHARYAEILAGVQQACHHPDVIEQPPHDGVLAYHLPRRLCRRCKLEEAAWHWLPSGSNSDGECVRLTGPVTAVTEERFRECREE